MREKEQEPYITLSWWWLSVDAAPPVDLLHDLVHIYDLRLPPEMESGEYFTNVLTSVSITMIQICFV